MTNHYGGAMNEHFAVPVTGQARNEADIGKLVEQGQAIALVLAQSTEAMERLSKLVLDLQERVAVLEDRLEQP